MSEPLLRLDGVDLVRDGRHLLNGIDLTVHEGEQWALLGPNGAGKTTLLSLLGAHQHPTRGYASVLGRHMGRVDVRWLRTLIGHVDPRHPARPNISALEVVLTGATGSIEPVPTHDAGASEISRAEALLQQVGMASRARDPWGHLSQGERSRTLIARALMPEPRLLLLDEPATGLDLGAREGLLATMSALCAEHHALATVTVTHHLEDLSPSTTHAILLRDGQVSHRGLVPNVLTSEAVSDCFGITVTVSQDNGRWRAKS